jgi:SAM-dependent methyltransferase
MTGDSHTHPDHRAVYDRSAEGWDRQRAAAFVERPWIDSILTCLPPRSRVLDLGCGSGRPIAEAFLQAGHVVTGLDLSSRMLDLARRRFPQGNWIEGDMRDLAFAEQFQAIVAWDSFFHLAADDQRALIPRLAQHLAADGWLLLTTGPKAGAVWGRVSGGAVWHDSLDPADYLDQFTGAGLSLRRQVSEDPQTTGHTVWLLRREV